MARAVKIRVHHQMALTLLLLCCLYTCRLFAQNPDNDLGLLGPPNPGEQTTVHVGFRLSDITDIDEEREIFEFESLLTLKWQDERQAFDPAERGVQEIFFQGAYQFNEVFNGWWPQLVLANESGPLEKQGEILRIQPDGSMTYIVELDGIVKTKMNLHHFPFDSQRLEIIFKCLGLDRSEVLLKPDLETSGFRTQGVGIAQWEFQGMELAPLDHNLTFADGHAGVSSHLAIYVSMYRNPNFILRIFVFPLFILIVLSWSIFWMNRSSLGDRMDISFVGILTVFAYQIVVDQNLPRIDYLTLMSTFLYLSLFSMSAGVIVNLYVAHLDNTGRIAEGEKVDRRSRWLFPSAYIGLNLAAAAVMFMLFK